MNTIELLSHMTSLGIQLWTQDGSLKYRAPAGALTPAIKAEILNKKEELIRLLKSRHQNTDSKKSIITQEPDEVLRLSFGQKWLWTLYQLGGTDTGFNIPNVMSLKGRLDYDALQKSLDLIVQRHEILRTVYGNDESGEAYQKILTDFNADLPVCDLSHIAAGERNEKIKQEIRHEMDLPFDLRKGPVFRAKLFRHDECDHTLLLIFHHITCDNQSLNNFLNELTLAYRAEVRREAPLLPELNVRYADYACWQNRRLTSDEYDSELSYWRETLKDVESIPEICGDYERPTEISVRSIREYYTMPHDEAEKLKALSRKLGCSFYVTLLSLYKILLFQYSGNRDIPVGSPVAGRGLDELEPLIGIFFNTVAVRGNKIDPGISITDYIREVKKVSSEAFQHQEIPFEYMVSRLNIASAPNRTPVFNMLFNMYPVQSRINIEGLEISPFDTGSLGGQNVNSKFDITLLAIEHSDGVQIDFSFKADLYKPETAAWLVSQFRAVVSSAAAQPELLISELPPLIPMAMSAPELYGGGYRYFPKDETEQSISACFDRQALTYPEKTAVEMDEKNMSYGQLKNISENLKNYIIDNVDPLPILSHGEKKRYFRQLALDQWGLESQEKLKGMTVFAAGAGGSGSPVIMQLALIGVGTIIICDFDVIEESNLNRQFLHDQDRIGMNKAESAALSVKRLNSNVNVVVIKEKIDKNNIDILVGDSAVIFDNVDNLDAKFAISECAVRKGIPHVISSIIERSSYAAIFHTPYTPCFHCCYDKGKLDTVHEIRAQDSGWSKTGIPVAAPGLFLCAGFAVSEALKIVLGFENPAYNKYFLFNNQGSYSFAQTKGFKLITYTFSRHFLETSKKHGFDWESGFSGRFVEEIPIERDPHCSLCSCASNTPPVKYPVIKAGERKPGETRTSVILMNHCIEAVAGILGILRAGYAFAYISPDYPLDRQQYILKDTDAHLILTDDANEKLAFELRDKVNRNIIVLNIKNISSDAPDYISSDSISTPDQLAYIVYTSGSTGTPKGVTQSHRNVLHYTRNYINGLKIGSQDRLSLIPSLAFSAAMMDIFAAFASGASLVLYDIKKEGPRGLEKWLRDNEISVYHSVPTIFRHFADSLDSEGSLPHLRVIDLGGEPVSYTETELFRQKFNPECILVNGLGATELNVIAQNVINRENTSESGIVPVGYPSEDTEIILLGEDGNHSRYNRPGEIVIKSAYLSPGYWGMEEQTNTSFKTDDTDQSKRLFYTGDIGRLRPDGKLEHLGRRDLQLKIRGVRIEALEIEAVLKALPKIKDAAICAEENSGGEKYIAAYFVSRENCNVSSDEIISHMRKILPEYMLPSSFTCLDTMPLTSTGKIDRKALKDSGGIKVDAAQGGYAPPSNELEKSIVEIWQKVLNLSKVGINDNFFDLGGHSLNAIEIVNSVKEVTGAELSMLEILECPTIAEMARLLSR